ncbi:hypothetical protein [Rhodococcus koreensis]|nr:hypothetical protein [Rhodococcus koreensis]
MFFRSYDVVARDWKDLPRVTRVMPASSAPGTTSRADFVITSGVP